MASSHLSDRQRVETSLSTWVARLLGPFPDEIGWRAVIARWLLLGGIIGVALQSTTPINPWAEIACGIGFILFTIACFTS